MSQVNRRYRTVLSTLPCGTLPVNFFRSEFAFSCMNLKFFSYMLSISFGKYDFNSWICSLSQTFSNFGLHIKKLQNKLFLFETFLNSVFFSVGIVNGGMFIPNRFLPNNREGKSSSNYFAITEKWVWMIFFKLRYLFLRSMILFSWSCFITFFFVNSSSDSSHSWKNFSKGFAYTYAFASYEGMTQS